MVWTKAAALELGKRIRVARKDLSLTQESLAYQAGITKNQVQLIEAGRGSAREDGPPSNPRLTTLFGLAEVLKVSPASLIDGLD